MFKHLTIGKRLSFAFAGVLCFVILVAVAGFWGLGRAVQTTLGILSGEAKLVEHSLEARASTLGLRRFEKDYFLNIGEKQKEAEYMEKWTKQRERLVEHLDVLEKTAAQPLSPELAESLGVPGKQGAVVGSTMAGSPAAAAGLLQNDVILAYDKTPVESSQHFQRLTAETRVGSKVVLQVLRKKQKLDLTVTVAEAPDEAPRRPPPPQPKS